MYPYHNRIKQRIAAGELIGAKFEKKYPGVGECLLLIFNTAPRLRPIRPYRYPEYREVIERYVR